MPQLLQQQQFGRGVGGVLALAGGWLTWRDAAVGPWLLGGGLGLVAAALLAPRALTYPARAWMALATALSYVSTRLILAVVFFGIVTPLGIVRRLTGRDPLGRRGGSRASYWHPYPARQADPSHYEKMF